MLYENRHQRQSPVLSPRCGHCPPPRPDFVDESKSERAAASRLRLAGTLAGFFCGTVP
jgi:hypothetical protein